MTACPPSSRFVWRYRDGSGYLSHGDEEARSRKGKIMRGIVVTALLGLVVVGTASSSYVAYSKATEGRTDACEVKSDSLELDNLPAVFQRARLMKRRGK